MLIDVHAHIFAELNGMVATGPIHGIGYGRASVGGETIQLLPPLNEKTTHTPEMLIAHMDWAGVDKAVLLQGPFYGECNHYVLDAIRRFPDRLIGSACIDPWTEGSRAVFDEIRASGGFRAVKLECSESTGLCGLHPAARLDVPENDWLWRELEREGLVLVLDLGAVGSRSYQTEAVRAIAERLPALKIVIAHLAQPTPAAEADSRLWQLWEEQIDLGLLPNVWFDTASLPTYVADEGYPFPTAARYLQIAVDRVGAGKIMWGTDIPGLLGHVTYPQLVKLAELHAGRLSPAERELILGGTAAHIYCKD